MRNFEADKLVRVGDVMDILGEYLGAELFPDITNDLLEAAERLENAKV